MNKCTASQGPSNPVLYRRSTNTLFSGFCMYYWKLIIPYYNLLARLWQASLYQVRVYSSLKNFSKFASKYFFDYGNKLAHKRWFRRLTYFMANGRRREMGGYNLGTWRWKSKGYIAMWLRWEAKLGRQVAVAKWLRVEAKFGSLFCYNFSKIKK